MSHHMLSGARPRALAVAVTLACLAPAAMAAGRQDLHAANLSQLQAHYSSLVAAKGVPTMAHTRHEQLIGADADTRLVLMYRNTDHGVRNTRYQQTFRGIPVFGESIVVSEDTNGKLRTLFGRQVTGLASEISAAPARVFQGQALAIAKQAALGASLGAMRTSNEKSELMIYVDDAGHAHKAYVVNFFADTASMGRPTRPFVIVDADSGKVLKKWEGLTNALIGTGPGGNAKTGQYEWGSGGIYGFLDVTQSGSTCTMDNGEVRGVDLDGPGGDSSTLAFNYTCPRNTYKTINSGYSPINDAYYFGGVITQMYPAYTGYDALSFQLIMRVHYGTSYENAFWNGSTMTFGDGRNTFYPLVSADVAGHEVSHGFTEQHSGLVYSAQSGGMNEAFSDMGGEATEYYWKGTNDFLVGQEIFKGSASQALRYMCNPTQDGISIDNAANYRNGMDPHYSSGVYNKAFCTLAKTSGWDTPKAFQVFARANANYWTPNSTFNQGACGVETAATDLGYAKADVTAAFTAVGVSCSGGGNTAPVANFTFTTSRLTANFTDTSTDAQNNITSRSWNFGDGSTSTATNPSHAYAAPGRYKVVETVTDAGGLSSTKTARVTVRRR